MIIFEKSIIIGDIIIIIIGGENMKKIAYETPSVEIVIFKDDIIVTSGGNISGGGDEWGGSWGDDF